MTEIILVRHGKTDYNKEGRLQGQLDIPLNIDGLGQAKHLRENLSKIDFNLILSSELQRAVQCAGEVAKEFPEVDRVKSKMLMERNFGEHHGDILDDRLKHFFECDCPGGEKVSDMIVRVKNFFEKIVKDHPDERILAVTHSGFLMLAMNHIFKDEQIKENARRHKEANGSYLKLDSDLNVENSLINVNVEEIVKYLIN